jgi:peptide/nickel transport system permease protein
VMETDYVRLARLKGVPESRVIWKHAFRNALIPILSLFSLQLIFFVSGSVIIENIFAWPGIGQLTVQAIFSRDYPLVQTIVLVTSSFLVLLNVGVDLLYAFIDPRIRLT